MNRDRARAVWEAELERLELDVISVERLLRGLESAPIEPWRPPAVLGAMPVDLAAKACELLARQLAATSAMHCSGSLSFAKASSRRSRTPAPAT